MILAIITLAAALGLVALALKLNLYSRAKIDLDRAAANLSAHRVGTTFDTEAKEGSIVAEFAQDIASRMPVAAALASAEKRDEASYASAASSNIISLLLVVGLAGTLWAFSGALGNRPNLAETAGGIDAEAVIKYTDQVHSGLTGAFWPSFAGIVCTVALFAMRGFLVYPKRDLLFIELERFGHNLALKLAPPHVGDNAAMLLVIGKMETIAVALESNSGNLTAAAGSAKIAAENLAQATVGISTANRGFEKTFGTQGVAAKGLTALRAAFTEFSKSVKEERKQRKKSDDAWMDALAKIEGHAASQESLAGSLEKIGADFAATQAAQNFERNNVLKEISGIVESLGTTAQTIEAQWETKLRDTAATIISGNEAQDQKRDATLKETSAIIDSFSTTAQEIASKWETTHRDAMATFGDAVSNAIQMVATSAEGVPEKIAQAKLALDEELLRVQRAAAEAHSELLRRIEASVKTAVDGTARASSEMVALERGLAASMEGLTRNVNTLVNALNSIVPHLRPFDEGVPEPRLSLFQKVTNWARHPFRRK